MSLDARAGRLPIGLSLQDSLENLLNEGKQMTASAGASSTFSNWKTIDWDVVANHVKRLQMRIAEAIRAGKHGKAKSLQWLLSRSYYAKLLAVKRVTQNKGSKTPGVDGVVWNSDKKKMGAVKLLKRRGYNPLPLRRVYIPKKNGKKRPLGIPCSVDKAQQALHLMGLEPISETLADRNSYGFRPKRSVADAIEQCFKSLCRRKSAQWILEGDIKACFDEIGHQWLLDNIPMDKTILKQWLKSGYIDKGMFYRTDAGTPQGGIISPTLMLMTLRGLEQVVKQAAPNRADKVNFISYADDFVITGASAEVLENKVKPVVRSFLKQRGLELSEEKTQITHIDQGFDFLGFNLRKYNGTLLTKPAKQNVLAFVRNIKAVIKKHATMASGELIGILNPKITGWGYFYRHCVANQTFSYVDSQIFESLYNWAKRRHQNKSTSWIVRKYFRRGGKKNWKWSFFGKQAIGDQRFDVSLMLMQTIPIKRHLKIKSAANPYDPAFDAYFAERSKKKTGEYRSHWHNTPTTAL